MTQPDVQATLQARFVDDDTLVRTGRALLEVNGHGWVVVPVPAGWAEQVQAVLDVEVDTDTISVFVEAAEAAASSAEAAAVVAEAAAQEAASGVQLDTVGRAHLTSELRGEIDGKAPVSHDHTIGQVSGLDDELDGKAPVSHDHTIEQVWGLQDELDGKAAADHTHSQYATTAQVEARTPEIRIVSSPEMATSPGVMYVVMED